MYNVEFIVNASGARVKKSFSSPYKCRVFVNKLLRSKKCTVISYPIFD